MEGGCHATTSSGFDGRGFAGHGRLQHGELALNSVTDSEFEAVKKLRTGQYTLISNQELVELKHDAELGKSAGRYQIHREGMRTWRLDTTTGQVCLLLTTEQIGKNLT